jgi:hypothetical protein
VVLIRGEEGDWFDYEAGVSGEESGEAMERGGEVEERSCYGFENHNYNEKGYGREETDRKVTNMHGMKL